MAIIIWFALALGGCSRNQAAGPSGETATFTFPAPADLPSGQRAYFEDGKITSIEYQSAFAKFDQCAAEAGAEVREVSRDPATGLIEYQTTGDLVGEGVANAGGQSGAVEDTPLNTCFREYFDRTEMAFQLTDPAVLAAAEQADLLDFKKNAQPCLEENEVEVPPSLEAASQEFRDLVERYIELASRGLCTGSTLAPVPDNLAP